MRAICLACFATLCMFSNASMAAEFQSGWAQRDDSVWAGPEFWANPLQDWRVRGGRLECINAADNRNVQLLTYQTGRVSNLRMRVDFHRSEDAPAGWVGFRFGIAGLFDEYRHNAIFGTGLDAGLASDGTLFVGDARLDGAPLAAGRLELALEPEGDTHRASLTLYDEAGVRRGGVIAAIPTQDATGNVALVSHVDRGSAYGTPVCSFSDWQIVGENLLGGMEQLWGPILWTQYSLADRILRMSAHFPPIGAGESRTARLEVHHGGEWVQAATATIDDMARVALFRVEDWDDTRSAAYRVAYEWHGKTHRFAGTVRRDPVEKREIAVAGFTGNKDYGFPNREIVRNVAHLDPDLLFFSGDQIYESVSGYGTQRAPLDAATLDYLRKYYLIGWSFGDLLRNRPSVIMPDDHDVYQGNIWGAGGRKAAHQEDGGYVMPAEWVKMVERTQTAHMPDPYDPRPIEQGIGVYYTYFNWGGVSFAVIEDRKFKSGPRQFPDGTETADAVLLGERQMDFLRAWAADWRGAEMKATLSQTVFAQAHTHTTSLERPYRDDTDANGWPPEGRNRALREIRKAFAFMYAGDNHLPTVAHHGIDAWEDAGVSFTVPSIAVGYPRSWRPDLAGDLSRESGGPAYAAGRIGAGTPAYLGRWESYWGHPLTMLAAANPEVILGHGGTPAGDIGVLDQKRSGFGYVRFDKAARQVVIECYRILADLDNPANAQFPGWPVVVPQEALYGREAVAWLPTLQFRDMTDPVVQIVREETGEIEYTLRIQGSRFQPKVFAPGSYTLVVGDQEGNERRFERIEAGGRDAGMVMWIQFHK